MSETLQEFHDALMAETSNALRLMSEANRATARAIEAQAHLMDHLMDGIRRFRTVGINSTITLQAGDVEASIKNALAGFDKDLQTRLDRERGIKRQGAPIHQQPQTIIPGEPGSSIHRTREGREVHPLNPTDEPGSFTDVSAEALAAEIVPEIEIVDKPIEAAPENTTLDASGRLVYDPQATLKPDFEAIERMRLEDEAREAERIKRQEADEAKAEEAAAQEAKIERVKNLRTDPMPEKPYVEPEIIAEAPAPQPDTPAQAVHKAQKAVEAGPGEARVEAAKGGTAKDRILDHYAENGLGYEETAQLFDLSPSTVASYISVGRTGGDKRAAQGDEKRVAREDADDARLRDVLIKDAKSRNGNLVFPDDDMIGIPAYTVDYAQRQIDTSEGVLPLSAAWLRIMDLLKDRDEHKIEDVVGAGRFPNERSILKNLPAINEALAAVKLYVVAEPKSYQLAAIL